MKVLIAGAGSIGKRHAQNAKALSKDVRVFDADVEKSDFKSYEEALAWGPHAVVIATPHRTHIPLASQAVKAGAHVLIEKPISDRVDGVADFLAQADAAGRKVFVVCNMRFHPAVQALKSNLERIGNIYYARAHFGNYLPNMRPGADYRTLYCSNKDQGGGIILDGIHEIDYLSWLFGSVNHVSCEAEKISDLDIDVEDYAAMAMKHANGVRSEIHMDYLQQCKRRGCEIAGSKGTLLWESEGKNPEFCRVRFYDADGGAWQALYENKALDINEAYKILMDKFLSVIEMRNDDLLTGRKALEDLKVALAMLKSASEGRRIIMKEIA